MTTHETTTITALDYLNANPKAILWWTSHGNPTGTSLAWRPEYYDTPIRLGDYDSTEDALNSLAGTVGEDGSWTWDGSGRPTDERGNTLGRFVIDDDPAEWDRQIAEYASP